ncbi:hypothetical protein HRbin15_01296 [bacterium HR15]|nr:hypothetical protein HRbin15_01296 [bacterium HR15]
MRFALMLIALLVAAGAGANPLLRMPPNSYLVRPVSSARELAQQIRGEPEVAQRYARHFKQPAYALADFFEKNLRLTRLERSGEFFVYYAPPDGQLLVKRRLLPRGKEVFVLKSNNKPVLLAECGNPVTPAVSLPRPPDATLSAPATPAVVSPTKPELMATVSEPVLPGVEIVEVPLEEAVAADLFPPAILSELETLPESAPEPPPIVAPVAVTPQVPIAPAAHAGGWWAILPMLGLLFIPRGGGGPPDVIPEPATWLGLMVGLGMLYSVSGRAFKWARKASQRGESSR